jgi:excisionase family DNA binding protein
MVGGLGRKRAERPPPAPPQIGVTRASLREARNRLALRLPSTAMAVRDDTATDPAAALAPSPLSEPLLDAQAAAALLSVRPSWIYEAVRTGRVPHLKIGRHVRFLRSDLERWVVDQRRAARP